MPLLSLSFLDGHGSAALCTWFTPKYLEACIIKHFKAAIYITKTPILEFECKPLPNIVLTVLVDKE
jgi:hypothetical protein